VDEAELFGGVLYDTHDVEAAARTLAELLVSPQTDSALAIAAGLDPTLVDSLRVLTYQDAATISLACARGAAWVVGRRSAPVAQNWEPVASLPRRLSLPDGLNRTTGETLIGLANGATARLRLAAPYMDREGLGYLADSVVAATIRGVRVELFKPRPAKRERDAMIALRASIQERGDPARFVVLDTLEEELFPHLKVMTVDRSAAYIGSANLTAAALAGNNLELGILVHGKPVEVIDDFLDIYMRHNQ